MIIHLAQTTFIKDRDIVDNIALAQKNCGDLNLGIHANFLCAKIDLKKYFNSTNYDFLLKVLKQKGFHENFI